MKLYAITNRPEDPTSGIYATQDGDGNVIVQLFVDKDDAESYNIQLEALGQVFHVKEIEDSRNIDKLCELLGYAFTIVEPGTVVVPRYETQAFDFQKYFEDIS